ncbi:serine acetyltransferase [Achromobacter insolitus]|uniref:serine O-acetyltransferase n=1 Tax=Achromobacter insolitus TaxID=217204 RepID=UPI002FE0972E
MDDDPPTIREIYDRSHAAFNAGDLKMAQKLYKLNHLLYSSSVPPRAKIGKNSVFAYGGIGIVIHEGATIGERCTIGTLVTVGGTRTGVPRIGDDCYLANGSKILGNVTIGKCSIIGADAMVLTDIPPYSVVIGSPGKVTTKITPDNFAKYQGHFWCKNKPDSVRAFVKYHWGVELPAA